MLISEMTNLSIIYLLDRKSYHPFLESHNVIIETDSWGAPVINPFFHALRVILTAWLDELAAKWILYGSARCCHQSKPNLSIGVMMDICFFDSHLDMYYHIDLLHIFLVFLSFLIIHVYVSSYHSAIKHQSLVFMSSLTTFSCVLELLSQQVVTIVSCFLSSLTPIGKHLARFTFSFCFLLLSSTSPTLILAITFALSSPYSLIIQCI